MGGRGSGGHNLKSDDVKILEGNRGHRKLNKGQTPDDASQQKQSPMPTCPTRLDPEAKREWRRVCTRLADMRILHTVDRSMLAGYCSAYSRWWLAQMTLNKYGLTQLAARQSKDALDALVSILGVKDAEKNVRREARPEVKIAREALTQMRALAAELGLTPKSRTSVTPREGGKDNPPLDELDSVLGTKPKVKSRMN